MNSTPKVAKEELPEGLVVRLARRMARQDLYDSLLMVLPPLGASLYLLLFPGFAARSLGAITLAAAALLAAGLLVRMGGRRAGPPRVFIAARLLDERADGKERFMTLATLGSSTASSFLLARLRQEAARLGARVDLGRDFPYRIKRSFFVSLIATLIIVFGFRLWPPMASRGLSDPARVRQAAEELSRIPHLAEWARTLQVLADRLQDKHLSADEKRQRVQETLKKMENQSEQSRQGKGGDALGQAKEILQGIERELGKSQGQGGELKTNLPQDGKGKEKGSGSGGESGDDQKSAALNKKDSGEAGANRPKQGTEQKSGEGGQGGERKGGEGGKNQEGKKDLEGKVSKEDGKSGGKSTVGEEIPKGQSPEPYGEATGAGLKDGRFVTVQLPEEETGKSTGASDSGKRREVRPKIPLGNVPLGRPDARDALPERQHLPLEYRGMIR